MMNRRTFLMTSVVGATALATETTMHALAQPKAVRDDGVEVAVGPVRAAQMPDWLAHSSDLSRN